jgi:RNA recognition motif-containing protein
MNIYVGNLSPEATEADVQEAFTSFGRISCIHLIRTHLVSYDYQGQVQR